MKASVVFGSIVVALATSPLLVGCPSDALPDAGTEAGVPTAKAEWRVVLENLDGALLSVWGPGGSSREIFAVGGPLGNTGFSPLVLRYDGTRWNRLAPGGSDSFWWVTGTASDDVWLVGEKGRITHFDGKSFTSHTSNTDVTIYGAWAASKTDAWAVGGTPEGGKGPQNDVLLHFDGTTWNREKLPTEEGRTLFKVWGRSSDDLFVVGEAGLLWHRTATGWAREAADPPLARGTLLTAFGCADGTTYAVGGRDVLVRKNGVWSRDPIELLNDVNGGACGQDGSVVLVGLGGFKARLVQNAWVDDFSSKPYADLHGAFVDSEGALWGVGGGFLSSAKPGVRRNGVVARFATDTISSLVEP
jgi:hypothetical protein